MNKVTSITLSALPLALVAVLYAAEPYVVPRGNDTNLGKKAKPRV